jgi:hypothetical protein
MQPRRPLRFRAHILASGRSLRTADGYEEAVRRALASMGVQWASVADQPRRMAPQAGRECQACHREPRGGCGPSLTTPPHASSTCLRRRRSPEVAHPSGAAPPPPGGPAGRPVGEHREQAHAGGPRRGARGAHAPRGAPGVRGGRASWTSPCPSKRGRVAVRRVPLKRDTRAILFPKRRHGVPGGILSFCSHSSATSGKGNLPPTIP